MISKDTLSVINRFICEFNILSSHLQDPKGSANEEIAHYHWRIRMHLQLSTVDYLVKLSDLYYTYLLYYSVNF